MITWDNFSYFVIPAGICWLTGAILSLRSQSNHKAALVFTALGTIVFALFIGGLWNSLSRRLYARWVKLAFGILFS